jgi:hypothetical protein
MGLIYNKFYLEMGCPYISFVLFKRLYSTIIKSPVFKTAVNRINSMHGIDFSFLNKSPIIKLDLTKWIKDITDENAVR